MKKDNEIYWLINILLTIAMLITFSAKAQYTDTIYVASDSTYNSLDDLTMFTRDGDQSDICVLLNRGDEIPSGDKQIRRVDNIKFGAYGTGANPVVTHLSGETFQLQRATNVIIDGIDFRGSGDFSEIAVHITSGGYATNTTRNITIKNGRITHAFQGITLTGSNTKPDSCHLDSIYIRNMQIDTISEDGIFGQDVQDVWIDCCEFYYCNYNWYLNAPAPPEEDAGVIVFNSVSILEVL